MKLREGIEIITAAHSNNHFFPDIKACKFLLVLVLVANCDSWKCQAWGVSDFQVDIFGVSHQVDCLVVDEESKSSCG